MMEIMARNNNGTEAGHYGDNKILNNNSMSEANCEVLINKNEKCSPATKRKFQELCQEHKIFYRDESNDGFLNSVKNCINENTELNKQTKDSIDDDNDNSVVIEETKSTRDLVAFFNGNHQATKHRIEAKQRLYASNKASRHQSEATAKDQRFDDQRVTIAKFRLDLNGNETETSPIEATDDQPILYSGQRKQSLTVNGQLVDFSTKGKFTLKSPINRFYSNIYRDQDTMLYSKEVGIDIGETNENGLTKSDSNNRDETNKESELSETTLSDSNTDKMELNMKDFDNHCRKPIVTNSEESELFNENFDQDKIVNIVSDKQDYETQKHVVACQGRWSLEVESSGQNKRNTCLSEQTSPQDDTARTETSRQSSNMKESEKTKNNDRTFEDCYLVSVSKSPIADNVIFENYSKSNEEDDNIMSVKSTTNAKKESKTNFESSVLRDSGISIPDNDETDLSEIDLDHQPENQIIDNDSEQNIILPLQHQCHKLASLTRNDFLSYESEATGKPNFDPILEYESSSPHIDQEVNISDLETTTDGSLFKQPEPTAYQQEPLLSKNQDLISTTKSALPTSVPHNAQELHRTSPVLTSHSHQHLSSPVSNQKLHRRSPVVSRKRLNNSTPKDLKDSVPHTGRTTTLERDLFHDFHQTNDCLMAESEIYNKASVKINQQEVRANSDTISRDSFDQISHEAPAPAEKLSQFSNKTDDIDTQQSEQTVLNENSKEDGQTISSKKVKHLRRVTVIRKYIEPKKSIIEKEGFLFFQENDVNDSESNFTSRRRRSLSESDLSFFTGSGSTDLLPDCEDSVDSQPRRLHSLSCSDLQKFTEEFIDVDDDSESTCYDTDSLSYDTDSEVSDHREGSCDQDCVEDEKQPIVVPQKKFKKKASFIGKSISVDLLPKDDRYFSNIRNRRNGIITEAGQTESFDDATEDYIGDLIEFKKFYKKPKKGLSLAKSVESIFHAASKESLDEQHPSGLNKPKRRFLSGLFTKNEKMEYARDSGEADDDGTKANRKISVVGGSVKRVAGVTELFINSQGDVIRKLEIKRVQGQSLGFFIRFGNGVDRVDGIFISRVTLGSFVDENNLLHSGDEILKINKINVTDRSLEEVAAIMQSSQKLVIKTRSALPLPMNASPLIKNYNKKQQQLLTTDDQKNYSSLMKMISQDDSASTIKIARANSEPLDDQSSANHTPVTRERSVSLDHKDKVFTRGQMYRNGPTRSPIYDRKLAAIPDENAGGKSPDSAGNDHRAFSRASRYQAEKKSETNSLSPSPPNSHTGSKSPGLFRKNDRKKSGEGLFTAPSNDSLSSMSDDENAGDERLHVYPSDNSTPPESLKSYTGKLAVSVHKLIGRLSGIEADCYCTVEVDGESKASTQPQKIKELVDFSESFEIDLQRASVLSFHIFHKHGKKHHKLASQSYVYLENILSENETKRKLLLGTSSHVQMRIKINFTAVESYIQRSPSLRQNGVFGFNLAKTLAKEENTIPVIVRKCVEEIEKRALEVVGIYRISGNARKKKILRAQFEENSLAVDVSNEEEVDCHVLAGILKDYLRELPKPLISDNMYQNIYNKGCIKNKDQNNLLRELLKELPYTNRATLIYIMDHLKRVAAKNETNKMTHQNLAVCFGPVMMSSPVATAAMLDFKKQIDALEFLLNIWPVSVELQNGI